MNNHMNQKGFANISIIIGVIVIVGVAGYFIFTQKVSLPTINKSPENSINNSVSYHSEQVPESWSKLVYVAYVQERGRNVNLYQFSYPSDLTGEIKAGGGHSYLESQETRFDLGYPRKSLSPSISVTKGPIIIGYLGPIHSLHDFFTSREDYYGGKENMIKIRDAVINHISKLNIDNFCDELSMSPLNHSNFLSLSNDPKQKVSEREKRGDFLWMFPPDQKVVSCSLDRDEKIIEFIASAQVPERLIPNSPVVEQRTVGVIKFLPQASNAYSSFQILVVSKRGNQVSQLSESDISRNIYLMAKSFQVLND